MKQTYQISIYFVKLSMAKFLLDDKLEATLRSNMQLKKARTQLKITHPKRRGHKNMVSEYILLRSVDKSIPFQMLP